MTAETNLNHTELWESTEEHTLSSFSPADLSSGLSSGSPQAGPRAASAAHRQAEEVSSSCRGTHAAGGVLWALFGEEAGLH